MTDKMPDLRFHGEYRRGYAQATDDAKQKHADEIAALKAEHRAEISLIIAENQSLVNAMQLSNEQALAGLCDEIAERMFSAIGNWGGDSRDDFDAALYALNDILELIKQRISDE